LFFHLTNVKEETKMRIQWSKYLAIAALTVLATACGGGGGTSEPVTPAPSTPEPQRKTTVGIQGTQFLINGKPTYAGRMWNNQKIEGMLMNSRMVQAIFDDRNPATAALWAYPGTQKWDAERNTREFVEQIPVWRQHGLLGITVNLQGGSPFGYSQTKQTWDNTAFNADGSLDPKYMARLKQVLDRADEVGMVVILGLYYFGQDERLKDEQAVIAGTDAVVDWLAAGKYSNVIIEINNECDINYDHEILKPARVHELVTRVQQRSADKGKRLLVSTSYSGGTMPQANVVAVADYVLLHGNGVQQPARITQMVKDTRLMPSYRPMPIVFNEDDHFDFGIPVNNFTSAVAEYASWGYFDFRLQGEGYNDGYQSMPANWGISSDRKKGFFNLLSDITGEKP
jgi:hypothetical protein